LIGDPFGALDAEDASGTDAESLTRQHHFTQ